MRSFSSLFVAALSVCSFLVPDVVANPAMGDRKLNIQPYKRAALQNIVTWDAYSLFVRGERILFYSGEFHPFRLPVPSLWLDVFQKLRSLGYTGASFYVDWALVEGTPGTFSAEGVFALEPFFDAATKAGIYLLARPGPYINAEVSGGGFPGWLQRVKGRLRTNATDFVQATDLYMKSVGAIIAKAQITNGGPIILVQPENEFTYGALAILAPDWNYMLTVQTQLRRAGIVVPFISNDAAPWGNNAPGKTAAVDIYGHDGYPLGFNCASPTSWPGTSLPTNWRSLHLSQSPSTPYSVVEFQGGSFDAWGGVGFENCAQLLNHEFERVFNKNVYSMDVVIFNVYMTYGGTNWGNNGHLGGYTSYDYGAAITEDLQITREKYSEAKLEANFLVASPSYFTAVPGVGSQFSFTSTTNIYMTPMKSNLTQYFVARHASFNTQGSATYKWKVSGTSAGSLTIPQLSGELTMSSRDSKIHVTDYDLGGINLLYSSAEVYTWQKYSTKTVLVVYGGPGEQHEFAITIASGSKPTVKADAGLTVSITTTSVIVNWVTTDLDRVISIDKLTVYVLSRNSAYNYWVVPIPGSTGTIFTKTEASNLIVKAGYLVRTASISGTSLAITGDLNATTTLSVVGGAPAGLTSLTFNGASLAFQQDSTTGVVNANLVYTSPQITLPDLSKQTWYYIDSLPEIQSTYSDAAWTKASQTSTNNTNLRSQSTPTSLYGSDYGYHAGMLVYRGTFTATGGEKTIYFETQGGWAYGASFWLNSTFIASYISYGNSKGASATYNLPYALTAGKIYTLIAVVDNMGLNENYNAWDDDMKSPRGLMDFSLSSRSKTDVSWKLSGNLGGENYIDKTRGPLNEGGMWAERQGYHLPDAPVTSTGWAVSKGPTAGIAAAGVGWFMTSFDLNLPAGYDIPVAVQITSGSTTSSYRLQIFVNGWQFGKYVNNIGPQKKFPVPQGIWNYAGKNWVAVSLWALDAAGAKVDGVSLVTGPAVLTGRGPVTLVNSPSWTKRSGAY